MSTPQCFYMIKGRRKIRQFMSLEDGVRYCIYYKAETDFIEPIRN